MSGHSVSIRKWRGGALLMVGALAAFLGYLRWPTKTPAGQSPLVLLSSQNLESFRHAFNAADDRTRVIAFFSPT
jgi:hypothetical protein